MQRASSRVEPYDGVRTEQALARLEGMARLMDSAFTIPGTNIRMGLDAGAATALVLTGATKAEDLESLPASDLANLVLDRIDRLLPPQVWKELDWKEEPGPGSPTRNC